jgi:hypothetical protein
MALCVDQLKEAGGWAACWAGSETSKGSYLDLNVYIQNICILSRDPVPLKEKVHRRPVLCPTSIL